MTAVYRAKKLVIRNYRAVKHNEITIGTGGFTASGDPEVGKTTTIEAIHTLLTGEDAGPDAVRFGADRAEILADFDAIKVKRTIKLKGKNELEIVKADGTSVEDAPQTWLSQLYGPAIDPMVLLTMKAKERRDAILKACPVNVSRDLLKEHAPDLPDDFDMGGHGLTVLKRAWKLYYDRRTGANVAKKVTNEDAERAIAAWQKACDVLPNRPVASLDAAESALMAANARLSKLEAQDGEAFRQKTRTEKARATIATARERAANARKLLVGHASPEMIAAADAEVERLKIALQEATIHANKLHKLEEQRREHENFAKTAEAEADAAERSLSASAVPPVPPEDLAAARAAVVRNREEVALSKTTAEAARLAQVKEAAERKRDTAAKEWERLDRITKAFADDLPRTLIEGSGALPGLKLEDDEVFIDNVCFDKLAESRKVQLAVQVAKRTSRGAALKLLIVDGLERLGTGARYADFLEEATADGWQLIGSRVTEGALVVEAIDRPEPKATKKTEIEL